MAELDGDRAAAVDWGCGGVWELRETRAVLKAGSARAERLRRCGAIVSFELAGVQVAMAVFWGVEAGSWGMSGREGGRRGVWARRVGDHGKQEVAGALHGGGRRRSREVGDEI